MGDWKDLLEEAEEGLSGRLELKSADRARRIRR